MYQNIARQQRAGRCRCFGSAPPFYFLSVFLHSKEAPDARPAAHHIPNAQQGNAPQFSAGEQKGSVQRLTDQCLQVCGGGRQGAAGAINPVVEEANKKIMSFCAFEHDPLFEDEMLKGVGTGVYQQVFDTMDYDNAPSEELVDLLLDGLESVGYIV